MATQEDDIGEDPVLMIAGDDLMGMTAEISAAFVSKNSIRPEDVAGLIVSIHGALTGIAAGGAAMPDKPQKPAVPVEKSVTHDCIICLEDGKRFKSLKRHLHSEHGLSPDEYRKKWGLPKDYPMVAPAYASARSQLAKSVGLGRKAAAEMPAAAPVVADAVPVVAAAPPAKRGRATKASGNGAALQ